MRKHSEIQLKFSFIFVVTNETMHVLKVKGSFSTSQFFLIYGKSSFMKVFSQGVVYYAFSREHRKSRSAVLTEKPFKVPQCIL